MRRQSVLVSVELQAETTPLGAQTISAPGQQFLGRSHCNTSQWTQPADSALTISHLQPLWEEVFLQQPNQTGDRNHPLPVNHPVEGIHVLLVRVYDEFVQTHPWGKRERS